jgi:creatinine amidohydrolase/Fe(II)-dependent formamide hydrolase-like protein
MRRTSVLLALAIAFGAGVLVARADRGPEAWRADPPIVVSGLPRELADLTWPEVRALLHAGHTTAIVPTGGIEQNGPHLVLGKHQRVVRRAALAIAERLGDALVLPVIAYVPEGRIEPPEGHMRFPGTVGVPEAVFQATLEATARSLARHGFRTICFVGDSGGNQAGQAAVAERLSREWGARGARVVHVGDYYARNGQVERLLAEGETRASIGTHAGIRDTSEVMAAYPQGVRPDRILPGHDPSMVGSGVDGDPTRASAARGEAMLALKVEAAVRQIRAARGGR